MSMQTNLVGRLRNTSLPLGQPLLPLFEAIVNSIHSVGRLHGAIEVEIDRIPQASIDFNEGKKRGAPSLMPITGFRITDNGPGFTDANLTSFQTLDSDQKAQLGCRGVGRLMWLKAFDRVEVESVISAAGGGLRLREFSFTASGGVSTPKETEPASHSTIKTSVHLLGFHEDYSERAPKGARAIASDIVEHCLWYFIREGGAPEIKLIDSGESLFLTDVFDEYVLSAVSNDELTIKGEKFHLTHVKLQLGSGKQPYIAWGAAGRLVDEEKLVGQIPGLFGRLREGNDEFVYACYIASSYLDSSVRSDRIGFNLNDDKGKLFSSSGPSLQEIRSSILSNVAEHLSALLSENKEMGLLRVRNFVYQKSPRYRPILNRIAPDTLYVPPDISDRDLELLLHKHFADIEGELICEGQELMNFGIGESVESYRGKLQAYLAKVEDIKKSDLVGYVSHRKVVLDILKKAISRNEKGKYATEDLIHALIMPMRKTSNEITLDNANLWLVDERLAFHNFLASDKPLSSFPIISSSATKEPDIVVLNTYDEPLLIAEGDKLPLASITVIEIKPPMRNDIKAGEEKNPIEQALGYLDRVRMGKTTTSQGRLIPASQEIPGYCYILCDITETVETQCKNYDLRVTSDKMGYFGYNGNYKAYIEVISFDRLVNSATERNRAFFDKLGLPS